MIVSAIPFTGNKRKLWDQIEPLLPDGKVFVDMFLGGGTIALNATVKYDKVIGSELLEPLVGLHLAYKNEGNFLDIVSKLSRYFPQTKEGYLSLREAYNIEPSAAKLQVLILRSNSNMMRWNSSGGFNMTYGERNSYNLERMKTHIEACKDIQVITGGWESLFGSNSPLPSINAEDYVFYADPPYSSTTATYCESGAWGLEEDLKLQAKLLSLAKGGSKVVISNVFENRGIHNTVWVDFCNNNEDYFEVHHLERCYNNSSFRKGKGQTDEVLILSR